jgi:hypothetical protein
MPRNFSYQVAAPPERVVAVLVSASVSESPAGFALTDRTSAALVGSVSHDGEFALRRPRGLGTAPRVAYVKGVVRSGPGGSIVVGSFATHPLLRFARAAWVVVLLAFAVVVLPRSLTQPELLWIVVVIGFVVGLMILPFQWLALRDRAVMRETLRETLGRAGAVTGT